MEVTIYIDDRDYNFLHGYYRSESKMISSVNMIINKMIKNHRKTKEVVCLDEETICYNTIVKHITNKKTLTMTHIINVTKANRKMRMKCLDRLQNEGIVMITQEKTSTKPITIISYVE